MKGREMRVECVCSSSSRRRSSTNVLSSRGGPFSLAINCDRKTLTLCARLQLDRAVVTRGRRQTPNFIKMTMKMSGERYKKEEEEEEKITTRKRQRSRLFSFFKTLQLSQCAPLNINNTPPLLLSCLATNCFKRKQESRRLSGRKKKH